MSTRFSDRRQLDLPVPPSRCVTCECPFRRRPSARRRTHVGYRRWPPQPCGGRCRLVGCRWAVRSWRAAGPVGGRCLLVGCRCAGAVVACHSRCKLSLPPGWLSLGCPSVGTPWSPRAHPDARLGAPGLVGGTTPRPMRPARLPPPASRSDARPALARPRAVPPPAARSAPPVPGNSAAPSGRE